MTHAERQSSLDLVNLYIPHKIKCISNDNKPPNMTSALPSLRAPFYQFNDGSDYERLLDHVLKNKVCRELPTSFKREDHVQLPPREGEAYRQKAYVTMLRFDLFPPSEEDARPEMRRARTCMDKMAIDVCVDVIKEIRRHKRHVWVRWNMAALTYRLLTLNEPNPDFTTAVYGMLRAAGRRRSARVAEDVLHFFTTRERNAMNREDDPHRILLTRIVSDSTRESVLPSPPRTPSQQATQLTRTPNRPTRRDSFPVTPSPSPKRYSPKKLAAVRNPRASALMRYIGNMNDSRSRQPSKPR